MRKLLAVFWGFPYPAVGVFEEEKKGKARCIFWDAAPDVYRGGESILPHFVEKAIHQHTPQGFCTLGAPGPTQGLRITRAFLEGLAAGYKDRFFFCPSLEDIIRFFPPPSMDTWWLISCGTQKYPGVLQHPSRPPELVIVENYEMLPTQNVHLFSQETPEFFLRNFSAFMAENAWNLWHETSIIPDSHS